VSLVLQTYGIFFLSRRADWLLNLPHNIAEPACLIPTSNF